MRHRGFNSSGNHDVGIAVGNGFVGITDGRCSRRTGCHSTIDGTFGPESDGHLAGCEISKNGRNGKGRNFARTGIKEIFKFFFQSRQPPDGGTDDHTRSFGNIGTNRQAGIRQRHLGSGDGIKKEVIITTGFLFADILQRIEIFYFTGNFCFKRGAVKFCDQADARLTRNRSLP